MVHRQRQITYGSGRAVIAAVVCLMALVASVSFAADVSVPNVVKQTNDARSRNGLDTLTIDPLLCLAAQAKADDMAARGYFAHKTPDGRMPWDWIASAGYKFQAAAENLAVGYPSDAALISAWLESEGHRHNLLNQKYTDIGIGIARGKYKGQDTVFVVQLFGRPRLAFAPVAIRAAAIPFQPFPPPALALDASDLTLEFVPLAAVPLEANPIPFEVTSAPAFALDAIPFPIDACSAPAIALESAPIPFDTPFFPIAVLPDARLTSIVRPAN